MASARYNILSYLLFICLSMSSQFFIKAQESVNQKPFAFNSLSINDGLSQNSVISIAQDSIGYLWLATQDGLNKYNGRSFEHYDKQFEDITRPTFSRLGKIYNDKQNRLWIITNSGKLELYNSIKDDFKPITTLKNISSIFQDKNLNTYVGTYGEGLFKIDAITKDTLQILNEKDKQRTIYDFTEINNALIVAASGSVYEFKANNSYKEIIIDTHNNANFSTLETDKNGNLWIGTFGQGLYYKDHKSTSFIKYQHPKLPHDLNIEDLLIDKENRLWIATYGNGAYILDTQNNNLTNFTANKDNPFAIQYNDILCLYEDVTNIIWLGTDGAGANYYDAHLIKFNVLTNNQVPKTVNVDVVRSISTDKDDNIWIGTSGKGLTYINFETKEHKTFTTNNSPLASDRIISLLNNDNKLWIGHQGFGLNIRDDNGNYTSFPHIANHTIWRIVKKNNEQSWLCTERNGIILFDINKGILKQFNTSNSLLTTNDIKTVTYGENNELWIGSEDNGLYKLNSKIDSIINIKTINSKIKSLYYDNAILWIGTNGKGLKKYNTKTDSLKTYTKAEGLPNNVIYGILPDNNGNLWLSTNYGISKFTNQDENKFENYSNYDGLQALEFNTGAYYRDNNGNLYFGGLEGLNWFHPNQLTFNTIKPKTIITNFEVFTEEQPLKQNVAYKFNENTITFTFSSLHFSQPERNLYKYQLVNYDDHWINAENNNTAHYTNLPPNDYTFKVISSNYDGVWNLTPATYAFTIKQPWYATTLARIIYLILGLLSALALYWYLKWRWQMKLQLQFEHEETERLKKLDQFKTKLYTNISHEFRTPLTLISGPVDNQLSKPELSKSDKKELQLIKRNADRLVMLVDQMLDLSMLDSGEIKLKVSKGNMSVLLKQIVSAFQYKANQKNIKIKTNIQDIQQVWFDKDIIEKVTSNLLSNAVKYAPNESDIIFDATKQDQVLVLSIVNTSDRVGKKDLSMLFQRFYQDNELSDGVGVGLALVRDLVTLSKGSVIANNIDDTKIQFTVTLPINKDAFSDEDIVQNTIKIENETEQKDLETDASDKTTLLIIEDELDIRAFIISNFKNDYKIIEASNGKSGIEKAYKHMPDLIISDIMMPKKDGIELCNTLKYDEITSHIPIILLTAKVGNENEIAGLKTGADAYVTKPFNSENLKLRVEKLIENRKQLQKHFSKDFNITPEFAITSTENNFLNNVKEVLDKHLTESDFTSEKFSEHLLISRTQLHRKLKAIFGMSTTELIRTQRLKLSTELLKNSDATVSEIAYQVGFNSPSYFIKCFKESYNTTPSEFHS
ncbi:hybrid sensor histidine kinase/response regulator transcription factor [Winogradskyella schleiferi]|uniref:hybrid sensor histidine kinase/response regulator transcription factor n=1 Tax=Winogradskyella schleiferi TaxID=2686078 RepID=UPI001E57058B|nr:hybrid sensor histidine kinase/response regulator transcription factor [Winogradskyella schleiferi]